jgi:osmotically-inducible protein OsmY
MSDDNELKQAVLDELEWEPGVTAAHIGITSSAGVVTLMGHVESYTQKLPPRGLHGESRA